MVIWVQKGFNCTNKRSRTKLKIFKNNDLGEVCISTVKPPYDLIFFNDIFGIY